MKSSVGQGSSDVVSFQATNCFQDMVRQKIRGCFQAVFVVDSADGGPLEAKFRLCLGRLPEVFQLHRDVMIP